MNILNNDAHGIVVVWQDLNGIIIREFNLGLAVRFLTSWLVLHTFYGKSLIPRIQQITY